MKWTHRIALFGLLIFFLIPNAFSEDVRIVRDNYGIPHIFADTDEGAAYGLGYAQAEDRLEQILQNYRTAEGTLSEVLGPDYFQHDYRQRVWRHRDIAKKKYPEISAKCRGIIEAFQKGVQKYMDEHPDEVPVWAPKLEPWQVVALSRLVIWGWPEGDAGEDLKAGGIQPDPIQYHGSNEWLIAPKKSAAGVPIALIDPHLSWYGIFRFYEARFYGDTLNLSGVCILGSPIISLGHNEYLSVAMTTGSGDTADVFEETLNPDNPLQYEVDGEWKDMTVRKDVIRVRKEDGSFDDIEVEIHETRHGPVVATKDGKAYAMAIPYMEDISLTDQTYQMMTAKNLDEAKAALSHLGLMGQNVMVGTVDGDIYYQRTGKVPIRPDGVDPSKPIPGNVSKNDWLGIHPMEDLVQCENPPQGYMQNCNVSPFGMMKDSPMRLADY
ncbi:MAG: penicillin acylase family protein, partial [Candidatus Omnitrophica bacterium]|nr:penicillin acylase family protein [Candidatus Omnitrophota bacterium]